MVRELALDLRRGPHGSGEDSWGGEMAIEVSEWVLGLRRKAPGVRTGLLGRWPMAIEVKVWALGLRRGPQVGGWAFGIGKRPYGLVSWP